MGRILMNKLLEEVILKYSKINNNSYDDSKNVTSEFLDSYARDIGLVIKRDRKLKLTNFYDGSRLIGSLKGLRVSTTSKEAFNLCRDKYKLEKFLNDQGFLSLNSKVFTVTEFKEAKEYVDSNPDSAFVLKPLSLAGGKGIELNVTSENFVNSWNASIHAQRKSKVKNPTCIVQRFVSGFDVRVSVIEGQVSAVTLRLPAHVVGDGKSTIQELIKEKNDERILIKYFQKKLIPIDKKLITRLASDNKSLDDILKNNEVYLLSDISNLTLGGESIDITDIVSDEIKEIALNSIASIPGFYSGGVDMMTEDFTKDEAFIIEINTNANHTMHHLPLKGSPKEPFKDLLKILKLKGEIMNNIKIDNDSVVMLNNIYKFSLLKDRYSRKLLEKH
ncbi:Cyanophycin synthetase [Jeotgalicoccus meleagridis]|uniref:Cyanophycin synthetase n=2 Tax=Jeotgalicoccus meleagridis TaxID=2759181 RepID=A0A6V7RMN4_9STAP|nr:Cyanophycin synthetase [Jeotgalicoccus meleagridis]